MAQASFKPGSLRFFRRGLGGIEMMKLKWSEAAQREYASLKAAANKAGQTRRHSGNTKSSKQEGLYKQVHKTLDLLRTNTRHPSLQSHEYTSISNPYDKKQKV